MRLLYTLLFYAALPVVLTRLYYRGIKYAPYRRRWNERLALYTPAIPKGNPGNTLLWLHAVSVGEVEAAIPLAIALQQRHPDWQLLVTTTTPTGSERILHALGERIIHVYLPYDLPDAIERFLQRFNPVLSIVMETEIWPNLFTACHKRGIPLIIANARLSERSMRRYGLLGKGPGAWLAGAFIAAQTTDDAHRFIKLGVEPGQVEVTGNLKFDLVLPEDIQASGDRLRAHYFQQDQVLLLASSHEDEERQVIAAFQQVRTLFPQLRLAIAPRHPERFLAVIQLCNETGLRVEVRSGFDAARASTAAILVIDTLGELRTFYAACDIAFIGGSLVPVGGHNVLEAAALGVPSLFGPHTHNFKLICEQILQCGGALRIADSQTLAEQLVVLLNDRARLECMGAAAKAFVASNRGALHRHIQHIESKVSHPGRIADSTSSTSY